MLDIVARNRDSAFHRLHWEVLEDMNCWKKLEADVVVARRVLGHDSATTTPPVLTEAAAPEAGAEVDEAPAGRPTVVINVDSSADPDANPGASSGTDPTSATDNESPDVVELATPEKPVPTSASVSNPQPLRILFVSARPRGADDVPYLLISKPVSRIVQHANRFHRCIQSTYVRPATWENFKQALLLATVPYDIVHFDMHGRADGM